METVKRGQVKVELTLKYLTKLLQEKGKLGKTKTIDLVRIFNFNGDKSYTADKKIIIEASKKVRVRKDKNIDARFTGMTRFTI